LLTATELTLLGRLDLAYRRPLSGLYSGERRSTRSARSPEFSDFRAYVSGDDFRQIDWKAYARLERLMLRLYVAEEEACLNVVVDASTSMSLGEPQKWEHGRRVAAALAVLGLEAMDRVQVGALGSRYLPPLRGRDGVHRVWAFLEGIEPAGRASSDDLVRARWLRPGLTVVVSDFLMEGSEWGQALTALRSRRQEPVLWQVLAPDEEHPALTGDLKLIDAETDRARELTITPGLRREYLHALAAHRDQLARACLGAGGRFLHTSSSDDLEAAMVAALRTGVVKRG
jgi:uncharacterized protein (DUF58 family)